MGGTAMSNDERPHSEKRSPWRRRNQRTLSPPRAASPQFAVVHEHAAGIDIGGHSHWVAVPPERGGETVREFTAFTSGLHEMVAWLKSHGIRTVAMEATGVLWIPVFEVLETAGFDVCLVNAAHVKNVSGRKSDVLDCQWIQKLHACGLLQRSFRPEDKTVVLRSYVRQRGELVRSQSASTQRMQKALIQMNLQLHLVVGDITGLTGMSILKRLLAGERDPSVLASLRDARCRRSQQEIVSMNDAPHLESETPLASPSEKSRKAQKALGFDARTLLYQKAGADLTQVLGISLLTSLTVLSEIGTDMSRWPTV